MKILVSLVFAIVLKRTVGNITVVQKCPETKTAWDHRASTVTCENKDMKYHCIMSNTWTLLEVCLIPLNISENEDGCPTAYIFKSTAFWMFPFTPCSSQNTKCPQKGNGGYSSEQLFKYPACFLNSSERVSGDKESQQKTKETVPNGIQKYTEEWEELIEDLKESIEHFEEFYRTTVRNLQYLSIFALPLLCIHSVLCILLKRSNNQLIKEVMEQTTIKSEAQSSNPSSVMEQTTIKSEAQSSNPSSVMEQTTIKSEAQSSNPSSVIDLELKESKSFHASRAMNTSKHMFKVKEGYSSLSKANAADVKRKYTTHPLPDLRNGSIKTVHCLENECSVPLVGPLANDSTDVKEIGSTRSLPELRNKRTPSVMDSRD